MAKKPKEPPFCPFPIDTYLREQGFQIAARPAHGEAVWQIHGRWLSQHAAVEYADSHLPVAELAPEGE